MLERIQVPRVTAQRWQKMAEVPAAKVQECEKELTENHEELTSVHLRPCVCGGYASTRHFAESV
jgi:hypothetical protein